MGHPVPLRGTGDRIVCFNLHFKDKEAKCGNASTVLLGTETVVNCTHKHTDHTKHLTFIDKLLFKYLALCKNN